LYDDEGANVNEDEMTFVVQARFPLIADYLFVSRCTRPETIQAVKAMVEPIRVSFLWGIDNLI
jgi:hypothetical protein